MGQTFSEHLSGAKKAVAERVSSSKFTSKRAKDGAKNRKPNKYGKLAAEAVLASKAGKRAKSGANKYLKENK